MTNQASKFARLTCDEALHSPGAPPTQPIEVPFLKRREFLAMGGAFAAASALPSYGVFYAASIESAPIRLGPMAYNPATAYRPYNSKRAPASETSTWIQIDLGTSTYFDTVRLYPAFVPGGEKMVGFGFPLRFKIETADDLAFSHPFVIVDQTITDFPNPDAEITAYRGSWKKARYIRMTALKLRPSHSGGGYSFALSKFEIFNGTALIPIERLATGDEAFVNKADLPQLTRVTRPMGEGITTDNPSNLTLASTWSAVPNVAATPLRGVKIGDGPFNTAVENNIGYLLRSFSVEEMLRPFRERAGKPIRAGLREPIPFWDTELLGSSAGRFLMGAGNTLRWKEHAELRSWMDALVDGIEECRQPNGYIMAYPEDSIFVSERGGYTRAWVTHGLIEAAYAGNPKALPLLRGYYDWFNQCPYLPQLLRGATQGVQGMVANTRMYFTPHGKPEDIQVIQRYFQENYWLSGLEKRDKEVVWQYPYDRPHNYLITDFEAYLDLYRATGDKRYLRAMEGAWELYHDNWEHIGGSIAITEFGEFPPKSYRLLAQMPFCETGETCGSVFWALFNQRFHLMRPDEEKYVTEIEKSIYNVGMANQVSYSGIIYHARLVGQKGELHNPLCTNSCCEGQGTRLLGSIPEYIYSTTPDGVYVNLFAPSSIEWQHQDGPFGLVQTTGFPASPEVSLSVKLSRRQQAKIRIRVPSWASEKMPILVNGRLAATGTPSSYVTLDRLWTPEDMIQFTLPIAFKLSLYTGTDRIAGADRYALEYGPILMALTGSASAVVNLPSDSKYTDLLKQLQPDPMQPLKFVIEGHPEYSYIPYWKVVNEPFTCYPVIA